MLKMTPLHWCVERQHIQITKLLLDNQADQFAKNKFGKSAFDIAVEKRDDCMMDYFRKNTEEITEVARLLDQGVSFITDSVGTSALHLACKNGHVNTAASLMRAGISADVRTKVGKTPMHFAAQNGHVE